MSPVQEAVQKRDSREDIEIVVDRSGWCERVIALLLLIITGPLLALAALAIKAETPGPVFEKSECLFRRRRFTALKLRIRVHDPLTPEWDRERTCVGQLLEYTRLDLVPQLINVLRGEVPLSSELLQ